MAGSLVFNSQTGKPKGNSTDTAKKRKCGIMKALVGSTHLVKGVDGRTRSFIVRDMDAFPKAKTIARCLFCRKDWPTAEEMVEAHPSYAVMLKQNEPHVIVLWSDDPIETPDPNQKNAKVDPGKVIGFLSDEHGEPS